MSSFAFAPSGPTSTTTYPSHAGSITSIATPPPLLPPSLLLTTGSDKTIRLWDIRIPTPSTPYRATLPLPSPPTACSFGTETDGSCQVFAGCSDGTIVRYDLRYDKTPITPIIIPLPSATYPPTAGYGTDEVNSLSVHKGNLLFATDDAQVGVMPTTAPSGSIPGGVKPRFFERGHLETALVTAALVRPTPNPKSKTLDIITAGTDCKICLFDGSSATGTRGPVNCFEVNSDGLEDKSRAFNPPFVYGLAHEQGLVNGTCFAAAVGDGSVRLLAIGGGGQGGKRRCIEQIGCFDGGHGGGCCSVDFSRPESCSGWRDMEGKVGRSRWLVSGGNEGNVVVWDMRGGGMKAGVSHGTDINVVKCGWDQGWVWVGGDTLTLYRFDI